MPGIAVSPPQVPVEDDAFTRGLKDCIAGSAGGVLQVLAGQPFDTIKVRMQTQPVPLAGASPLYDGPLDCLRKTIGEEGPRALYKGMLTPLLGVGLCASVQFVVLEQMKRMFGARHQGSPISGSPLLALTQSELFLAGASAGTANSFISGPIEHIRTRLQVQTSATASALTPLYKGPWDCARRIFSTHGLRGVYKGQIPTMLREFFGYGVYFAAYERLVQNAMNREGKRREELETHKVILYGATAGYVFWFTVYPVDAIKSKMQTDGLSPAERKYKGVIDCAKVTWRQEGFIGFFRGFVPCLLRAAPANGATFLGFEAAMRFLN